MVPIWVTGEDSELDGYLFDALNGVTPKPRHVPVNALVEASKVIEGALVIACFQTIDDRVRRIVGQWERDLGTGRLLVFTSEEGNVERRVFAWKSFDENSLRYLIESELERIEMRTRLSVAETDRLAALQMSNELISGMAHDLRAPLNSIIGFAELLESAAAGLLNVKQNRYATNIASSGRTLLHLIDDIVDLSRIDSGRAGLEKESVELAAIVNEAIRPLKEKAQKRGVTFVLDSIQTTGGRVFVDRRRFRQAIHLLLSFQLEGGSNGERLLIAVDQNEEGTRLRMELEGNSDADVVAAGPLAPSAQTMWQKRYVVRVLEMHGAELVGWSNTADGRRRVEVRLGPAV